METAFRIVAEPNRRAILSLLAGAERSVGDLERQLRMSQPTVSKHLRVLRDAGFVESAIHAQRRMYRLRPERLQAIDEWLAPFRRLWSVHLDALERHLDRIDSPSDRHSHRSSHVTTASAVNASRLIDARIMEYPDWRGKTLARIRAVITAVDPGVIEEWKWRGVPVWSHDGIICTGEIYKAVVKMTFAKGASLKDPSGLFNSSLDGNTRRAIDIREGDTLNEKALKALIREAIAANAKTAAARKKR